MGCLTGLGCAGEIRISEHEDYDKWAIDILVKFRDDEKLQLLTGERQSGGVSRLHLSFHPKSKKIVLPRNALSRPSCT